MKKVQAVQDTVAKELQKLAGKIQKARTQLKSIEDKQQNMINSNDEVVEKKTQELADLKTEMAIKNKEHRAEIKNVSDAEAQFDSILSNLPV